MDIVIGQSDQIQVVQPAESSLNGEEYRTLKLVLTRMAKGIKSDSPISSALIESTIDESSRLLRTCLDESTGQTEIRLDYLQDVHDALLDDVF